MSAQLMRGLEEWIGVVRKGGGLAREDAESRQGTRHTPIILSFLNKTLLIFERFTHTDSSLYIVSHLLHFQHFKG